MTKIFIASAVTAFLGAVTIVLVLIFSVSSATEVEERSDCITSPGVLPGVVPQPYNSIFTSASSHYKIDPALEASIFESEHANTWPNADGPWASSPQGAKGPWQFVDGTWVGYSDANPQHPNGDVQNLADSSFGAAKYLSALGGAVNMPPGNPDSPRKGTVAWVAGSYNGGHPIIGNTENDRYRANAVKKYLEFKNGASSTALSNQVANTTCTEMTLVKGSAAALAKNPKITFTHPGPELNDLSSGRVSPRLIALLTTIASKHTIGIFALASDHGTGTNHEAGRAADIWMVDGDNCFPPKKSGACWALAQQLDRIKGCLHPTELIYYYDPGPSPDSIARADHDDHIHVGYDGPLGPKHYADGLDACSPDALVGTG
jgi:hypothetical protein